MDFVSAWPPRAEPCPGSLPAVWVGLLEVFLQPSRVQEMLAMVLCGLRVSRASEVCACGWQDFLLSSTLGIVLLAKPAGLQDT